MVPKNVGNILDSVALLFPKISGTWFRMVPSGAWHSRHLTVPNNAEKLSAPSAQQIFKSSYGAQVGPLGANQGACSCMVPSVPICSKCFLYFACLATRWCPWTSMGTRRCRALKALVPLGAKECWALLALLVHFFPSRHFLHTLRASMLDSIDANRCPRVPSTQGTSASWSTRILGTLGTSCPLLPLKAFPALLAHLCPLELKWALSVRGRPALLCFLQQKDKARNNAVEGGLRFKPH
ncbi:hypothetical protein M9H77_26632 [Catharanthus roseus]|uniref:Uncharacterized protein n=1 Tax=Catharanthus roseus TaxID=4058 RepID=A0ACC0ACE2_CATRO|nr:hypothetical protein M9H77_26632 [Catharanthus roseus]